VGLTGVGERRFVFQLVSVAAEAVGPSPGRGLAGVGVFPGVGEGLGQVHAAAGFGHQVVEALGEEVVVVGPFVSSTSRRSKGLLQGA
jgi:hypothetical protein